MLVIPAIDIYKNRVARLFKGDFETVKYYEKSPIEYAKEFSKVGLNYIHIVDLEASVTGKISVKEIIQKIKKETELKIHFGGGIKSYNTAKELLESGVDKIVIGSISISNKNEFEKIVAEFGNEKIIVATDSKDEKIMIKGWIENSNVELFEHIDYCSSLGLKYFLCTDISKDGTLSGPNFFIYEKLMKRYPNLKFIASGGISSREDLLKLNSMNLFATVVGKSIYENKIKIEELKLDS